MKHFCIYMIYLLWHSHVSCLQCRALKGNCLPAAEFPFGIKRFILNTLGLGLTQTSGTCKTSQSIGEMFFITNVINIVIINPLPPRKCGNNVKCNCQTHWYHKHMMTSSNGNIFRIAGPFLLGIHWSPVNSPHKGQWRRALMFSLICALYKRLSKQSWGWWFEMLSRSLWRHCSVPQIPIDNE